MHLFIELLVLAAFVATMAHLWRRPDGRWLLLSFAVAGWVRETYVLLMRYLYGFAPLTLVLGDTPVISFVIWGFSIYAALLFAETVTGTEGGDRDARPALLGAVAVFMMALAIFYEPFIKLIAMARWESGTRTTFDVPWIALVGYPTMAVALLATHAALLRRVRAAIPRAAVLALTMTALGVAHAAALQRLKDALGW